MGRTIEEAGKIHHQREHQPMGTQQENEQQQQFVRLLKPVLASASSLAMIIVRDRTDAEDVVQEASLKAFRAFDRYDPGQPFKSWFLCIVRNCGRDLLRRKKTASGPTRAIDPKTKSASADSSTTMNETMNYAEPVDPEAHKYGNRTEMVEALGKLTPLHQEILKLRYFGDMNYKELAHALQIPEGTVMSRLHAARLSLARLLGE